MFDNETDPKGRNARRFQFQDEPVRTDDDFKRNKSTVEKDKRDRRRLKLLRKQRKAS